MKPGKRYLVRDRRQAAYDELLEITVLEISPAGRMKVRYEGSGVVCWLSHQQVADLEVLEELPDPQVSVPHRVVRE